MDKENVEWNISEETSLLWAFALNWYKLLTQGGPVCLNVTLDQTVKVKFGIKVIFICSEHHSCVYLSLGLYVKALKSPKRLLSV